MASMDLARTANLPPVPNVFLPTSPLPKTTEDIEFTAALLPCIRPDKQDAVAELLRHLSEARRQAVSALDPSRTISSADAIMADVKKYLSLVKGFRGKAVDPEETTAAAEGGGSAEDDPLPGGPEEKAKQEAEDREKERKEQEELEKKAASPEAAADGDDGEVPPLLTDESGKPVASLVGAAASKSDGKGNKKTNGKKPTVPQFSEPEQDGTLRHMMAFVWKDIADGDGCSFRLGDSMLEEASVMFALANVLIQKAKAETLSEDSMLSIFKWLRQASGALERAMEIVRESEAPVAQISDDLKGAMLRVVADWSLAQAQHITIRRAQLMLGRNPKITHTLIAKLCHDTSERYRAMEKRARDLIPSDKKDATSIGAYFVAHIRYKCLFFMAMGYGMLGIMRVREDTEDGVAYGIRNLMYAVELFDKAEIAAKKFIDTARSLVFIDSVTILTTLDDSRASCKHALQKAGDVNNKVYFKPIPEKPDALPDRMSTITADPFPEVATSGLWTKEAYTAFDITKVPKLRIGKVPEDVDCCPVS